MNNEVNNQANDLENTPKKKNTGSILVVIILFLVGFGAGYFLSNENLFKKNDVKTEETNKEVNEKKDAEKTEEKKEQENPKPQVPVAQPRENLKLLKKFEQDINLNNNVLKYVAFYYSNDKTGVTKEVYLNGNKIVDLETVSYEKSDENTINNDNNNSFGKISYLNDTSNGKKYIVYFYDLEYTSGPVGYEEIDLATKVLLIDENINILFNKETFNSKTHYSLMVDSKADALDRMTYEYGSTIEIYAGDGKNIKASRVEFKDDHFYSLELADDGILYDYKYVVKNGVIDKTLLNKYNYEDKHVNSAGA